MLLTMVVIKSVVIFMTFVYAAISDWIKREVNPLTWIPSIAIGVSLNIYLIKHVMGVEELEPFRELLLNHLLISISISVFFIVLFSMLSFILNLLGGADVLALASLVSIYPANVELLYTLNSRPHTSHVLSLTFLLPPILIILLIYIFLITIPYFLFNVIRNVLYMTRINNIQMPKKKKLLYIFFGRILKVKDLNNKRFYYPLYVPGVVERITFNIEEDDVEWLAKIKNLDPDTVIVVSWGIPMVTFMAVASFIFTIVYVMLLLSIDLV